MLTNKEKGIISEKGFTMIELIIVIAIMGILSAILVPSFTQMTRKSRLRADISTIQQVQAQIDLYTAEHDGDFPGTTNNKPPSGRDSLAKEVVEELVDEGYIKESDTVGKEEIKLQSKDVEVYFSEDKEHLILAVDGAKEKEIRGKLSASDREWAEDK